MLNNLKEKIKEKFKLPESFKHTDCIKLGKYLNSDKILMNEHTKGVKDMIKYAQDLYKYIEG